MIAAFVISIPILALSYLIGWALWRLANSGQLSLEPTPLKSMHAVPDSQAPLPVTDVLSGATPPKQTPATNRLHIPPPYYSSQRIFLSISLKVSLLPSNL